MHGPRGGTVWVADQLLLELRANDGGLDVTDEWVAYTQGPGIDAPLMVRAKLGRSTPYDIIPLPNWRGLYEAGVFPDGRTAVEGLDLKQVLWPGKGYGPFFETFADPTEPEPVWLGSLMSHKRDASGQLYMRNRYYDPQSGRFTQEDPIGMAGGLNLYGFGGGDPVNYSDPYGLCAKDKDGREDSTCRGLVNYLRAVAQEARVAPGHVNQFSAAADVYESTNRRVEFVHPRDRQLYRDGNFAAGRTKSDAFLLSNALGGGDLAAVAAHEALVHGHEGLYMGDLDSGVLDRQIWYQLPTEMKSSAPFWKNKVGIKDEPLIW